MITHFIYEPPDVVHMTMALCPGLETYLQHACSFATFFFSCTTSLFLSSLPKVVSIYFPLSFHPYKCIAFIFADMFFFLQMLHTK